MKATVTLRRRGGSLVFTVPRRVVKALNLKDKEWVELEFEKPIKRLKQSPEPRFPDA